MSLRPVLKAEVEGERLIGVAVDWAEEFPYRGCCGYTQRIRKGERQSRDRRHGTAFIVHSIERARSLSLEARVLEDAYGAQLSCALGSRLDFPRP